MKNAQQHLAIATIVFSGLSSSLLAVEELPKFLPEFIDQHCADCHDDVELKGNLDLWTLSGKPMVEANLKTWIRAFDQVSSGTMPPEKKPRPSQSDKEQFLAALSESITQTESDLITSHGRSVKRRLNRYEYENTLRDLLSLPHAEIKDTLPEDPIAHGYNRVGEALDVSHVQMARYLKTAEATLREAIAPQVDRPATSKVRYYTWQQKGFRKGAGPNLRKTYPVVGHELRNDLLTRRHPETREWIRPDIGAASENGLEEREAIIMLMSTYEPAEIKFDDFRAPVSGYYNLTFSGYTVWMSPKFEYVTEGRRTEPISIYSETPPRQLRKLGAFDFGPEPTQQTIRVFLKRGESIQPDATRLVRSRPPDFENPFEEEDGMPGVAFQWMEVEGPFFDQWPEAGHRLLFGDLPIEDSRTASPLLEEIESPDVRERKLKELVHTPRSYVRISSQNPRSDAAQLLRRFLDAAYRRPVPDSEYKRFLGLIENTLEQGFSFADAMIAGYTAVLSSPGFLYLHPNSGEHEGYALAEKLSYFLWNSPPDAELLALAANGRIADPKIKSRQVERLLADPRSERFVEAFLDYWLDLRKMGDSGPDAELYPEYQLDDSLTEALPLETRLYFSELIKSDSSVKHVVDSDFAIINERLATLYDIPGVRGAHFRKVDLPDDSPRGGLMTHGSVLKVTANGTTSSPVTRGAWIMERILGEHIPPPPPSVEAIESDIRGAKTIREQLALHRSQESCNRCHRLIDPAGFALENFDVMGGWRDAYRATAKGQGEPVIGVGHDGQEFKFRRGQVVDASGELPSGERFHDIRELKALLKLEEKQLAKNLVEQLAIYATGSPIRFSDRQHIEKILQRTEPTGYGIRSLIHELVKSDLFL